MKHNEKMENLKGWSDAVKEKLTTHKRYTEEEFTYPMWFRAKYGEIIVRFISLDKGIVVFTSNEEPFYKIGMLLSFQPHTDTTIWQQVENPFIDAAIETVINEEYHNAHYKAQKIDTIARCKANMTLEQQKAICIFNIDRYLHREKGQNLSDIKKIKYYTNWLEEIENALSDS